MSERKTDQARSEQMARKAVESLAGYIQDGRLPNHYKTVQDMLYDFYPDLP